MYAGVRPRPPTRPAVESITRNPVPLNQTTSKSSGIDLCVVRISDAPKRSQAAVQNRYKNVHGRRRRDGDRPSFARGEEGRSASVEESPGEFLCTGLRVTEPDHRYRSNAVGLPWKIRERR